MTPRQLDQVERSVLKSLQTAKQATPAEVAAALPGTGVSDVKAANNALLAQHLVEPVPGATDGSLRLTAHGMLLAQAALDETDHTGSGGGDTEFE